MTEPIDLHKVLDVIQGCHISDYRDMTPATAATAMKAIIMGAVRAVMENYTVPVFYGGEEPERQCKRGNSWQDGAGNPFPHVIPEETKVCVFCGFGAKEPPPEAREKPLETDRFETMVCPEHGFHKLMVHPDGSYDKPDCRMFHPEQGDAE